MTITRKVKEPEPLSKQVERRLNKEVEKKETIEYTDGDFGTVISTGSTLLDLAISGGRVRGGGLPGGIFVEAFGPSGSGKTVLLSEIAGAVQRQGGDVLFHDPEARLNKQFAQMFGLTIKDENYKKPSTVPEVFKAIRSWEPEGRKKVIHGIFADSLAALSTATEMDNEAGDKMGMRRAKEFSQELRQTCRMLVEKNYLLVCSNQVRVNVDAGMYGQKFITPGGESVGFYASLRLRFTRAEKIKIKRKIAGKEETRVIGVEANIEVYKSSIWQPFHSAPVTILFNYGIDSIRDELQFIKDHTKNTTYCVHDMSLSNSLEEAIKIVETEHLERSLKGEVIDLWEYIEKQFVQERKPKR